jgi:hypothetical protein
MRYKIRFPMFLQVHVLFASSAVLVVLLFLLCFVLSSVCNNTDVVVTATSAVVAAAASAETGYAPMMVRLVQLLCLNGCSWGCILEVMRQLPGPLLEFTQQANCPEDLRDALER